MHSFALTQNYIILTEIPLVFNPVTAMLRGKAPKDCLEWKPERGTNFLAINKHSGKLVAQFQSAAFFAFHHINSYETNDEIIVDVAATDEPALLQKAYLNSLRAATRSEEHPLSEYRRYRLPLTRRLPSRLLQYELMCEPLVEMVTVNSETHSGQPYRYAYGVSHKSDGLTLAGQLVKIDLEKQTASQSWFEPNCYPNEPTFVRTTAANREDEGVILTVVLDTARVRSFLMVLDATTFQELARLWLPHHIPLEFHGLFTRR